MLVATTMLRRFGCAAVLFCLLGTPAIADSELSVAQPTFYILAPGSDSGIAPVASAVTARLQKIFDAASGKGTVWVIPRLNWGPDDLYNQCENDPTKKSPTGAKVLGGLILDGTNTYTGGVNSYLLWVHSSSTMTTHAQLVSCTPTGFPTPTITWVSDELRGYGSRNGFPLETGVPLALYFGSNANSEAKSVALGASIGALGNGSAGVPPVDPVDTMHDAARRAANDLVNQLVESCKSPTTTVRPMCARMGLASPTPAATP